MSLCLHTKLLLLYTLTAQKHHYTCTIHCYYTCIVDVHNGIIKLIPVKCTVVKQIISKKFVEQWLAPLASKPTISHKISHFAQHMKQTMAHFPKMQLLDLALLQTREMQVDD